MLWRQQGQWADAARWAKWQPPFPTYARQVWDQRTCFCSGDCFEHASAAPTGWHYVGPRRHIIFGWLQVEDIVDLGPDGTMLWHDTCGLARHPHVRPGWTSSNAIFIAKEALAIGDGTIPGFGVLIARSCSRRRVQPRRRRGRFRLGLIILAEV